MSKLTQYPAYVPSFADRLLWALLGFGAALLLRYAPDSLRTLREVL